MKIDYQKELENAAKNMILIHKPDVLIRMIVRRIVEKVKISHAGILLHEPLKGTYVLNISRGAVGVKIPEGFVRMDTDNPLVRFFSEGMNRKFFDKDALLHADARRALGKKLLKPGLKNILKGALYQMDIFEARVCLPIYFGDELLGILFLGGKNNRRPFAAQEIGFFTALTSDVAMAIRNAQLFSQLELALDKEHRLFMHTTIALAAAIDAKDHYTHGHTERVTLYSLAIAGRLSQAGKAGIDPGFTEQLRIASLLHDIGKIGIPEAILNKDSELTVEEKKCVARHPLIGVTILGPIKELTVAIGGVKYHHERFDGLGYPEGLKAGDIPLIAAIISVADTFDAMTTNRPYRSGLSKEEAIQELEAARGSQLDPEITDVFIKLCQEGKV